MIRRARRGTDALAWPAGSFLPGGDDPGGDIEHLLAAGGSRGGRGDADVTLGRACLFAIALHRLWVARRGWRQRASPVDAWRRLGPRSRTAG